LGENLSQLIVGVGVKRTQLHDHIPLLPQQRYGSIENTLIHTILGICQWDQHLKELPQVQKFSLSILLSAGGDRRLET
jgi:hypothetical protein